MKMDVLLIYIGNGIWVSPSPSAEWSLDVWKPLKQEFPTPEKSEPPEYPSIQKGKEAERGWGSVTNAGSSQTPSYEQDAISLDGKYVSIATPVTVSYVSVKDVPVNETNDYTLNICDCDHSESVWLFVPDERYGRFDYQKDAGATNNDSHLGSESNPLEIQVKPVFDNGNEEPDPLAGNEAQIASQDAIKVKATIETGIPSTATIKESSSYSSSSDVNHNVNHYTSFSTTGKNTTYNLPNFTNRDYDTSTNAMIGRTLVSFNGYINGSSEPINNYELGNVEKYKKELLKALSDAGDLPDNWYYMNTDNVRGLLLKDNEYKSYEEVKGEVSSTKFDEFGLTPSRGGWTLDPDTNVGVRTDVEGMKLIGKLVEKLHIPSYTFGVSLFISRITSNSGIYRADGNPDTVSGRYRIDDYLTHNYDRLDAINKSLKSYEWQSDYVTNSLKENSYSLVPEVLMTYKDTFLGSDGTPLPYNQRGKLGHVYVASYNEYKFDMPMYSKLELDYNPQLSTVSPGVVNSSVNNIKNVKDKTAQEQQSKKDNGINGINTNINVVVSGAEMNTIANVLDGEEHSVTFTTWVVDFRNANPATAWNNGYSTETAKNAAQSWLNGFVEDVGNGAKAFKATTTLTSSFTKDNEAPTGVNESVTFDNNVNAPIAVTNDLLFGTTEQTQYKDIGSFNITIRNGRLAYIENHKVYDFNDEADFIARDTAFVNQYPEIAEAIVNLKLFEFANTLVSNAGSETWGQYNGSQLGKDNMGNTVVNEVGKEKSAYMSNISGSQWFAEDSTVLRVRKFSTKAEIPSAIGYSWKLPLSYGYDSPSNKRNLYSKFGYCFAELGFDFGNQTVGIRTVTDEQHQVVSDDKKNIKFDVSGNETTGVANVNTPPQLQFIVSDASVNDLYQ